MLFRHKIYNDLILKPKKELRFKIKTDRGKGVYINLKKHELIDLNKQEGTFFVRNLFSGENHIMSGDSETHIFQEREYKAFLKNIEDNFFIIYDKDT